MSIYSLCFRLNHISLFVIRYIWKQTPHKVLLLSEWSSLGACQISMRLVKYRHTLGIFESSWDLIKHFRGYWHDRLTVIHYSDVKMGAMASQITGVSIVCSVVCSGADQIKHQSSASLAFVMTIHRWPVNSPQNGPVARKMFEFSDVIMSLNIQITHKAVHWSWQVR